MVDLVKAEQLINEYVKCWEKQGLRSGISILECNDFGYEHLQLIRNGFLFETFSHDELSRAVALLTRELKGQINYDHKFFWAYCAHLVYNLREVGLFSDHEWKSSFINLVHLVLSERRREDVSRILGNRELIRAQRQTHEAMMAKCVNSHLLEVSSNKWEISAPFAFSLVEGLLRRKNRYFVNLDGTIRTPFEVANRKNEKTLYGGKGKKRLNRIGDSLRCFEQVTLPKQNKPCNYLQDFKTELCGWYLLPLNSDVYELIDSWRNDLIHGNKYWTAKIPALLNLTCLLLIDEIEPNYYDSKQEQIQRSIEWEKSIAVTGISRAFWEIYPPDL